MSRLKAVDQPGIGRPVQRASREFADGRIDLDQLEDRLCDVDERTPTFPLWLQVLGAGALSATLMVLFLNVYDWLDLPVAGVIGAFGYWFDDWLNSHTRVRFWPRWYQRP